MYNVFLIPSKWWALCRSLCQVGRSLRTQEAIRHFIVHMSHGNHLPTDAETWLTHTVSVPMSTSHLVISFQNRDEPRTRGALGSRSAIFTHKTSITYVYIKEVFILNITCTSACNCVSRPAENRSRKMRAFACLSLNLLCLSHCIQVTLTSRQICKGELQSNLNCNHDYL